MRLSLATGLCIGLVATAMPTHAQQTGDVAAGRQLANRWCADCHIVGTGQPRAGNDGVPSFAAIADTRGMTEMSLKAYLATPHPPMPNIALTRQQMDEIVAYILSLQRR